jgi:hypothetical protein
VSTCRTKCIQRSLGHRPRLIFLDPFAVLFGPRTGKTLCRAQRCLRALPVTHALLALLFVAGSSLGVAAQIRSSQSQTEQSAAVKVTYEAYLRAWNDKNLNALNRLLSDDYQAVNFQGIDTTKANEIATAKEDPTYNTLSGNVLSVALFGDCAIVSGLIEANWERRARKPADGDFSISGGAAEAER